MSKYGESHAKICMIIASSVTKLIAELRKTSYQQEAAVIHLCELTRKRDEK
jgi:hypothetical protein